jgi:hypothetical protein
LQIARDNPEREVVFFAIGFETTTPPTAVAIQQAEPRGLKNFSVLLLPRADALGDQQHPRIARGARSGVPCRSTASSARRTCRP